MVSDLEGSCVGGREIWLIEGGWLFCEIIYFCGDFVFWEFILFELIGIIVFELFFCIFLIDCIICVILFCVVWELFVKEEGVFWSKIFCSFEECFEIVLFELFEELVFWFNFCFKLLIGVLVCSFFVVFVLFMLREVKDFRVFKVKVILDCLLFGENLEIFVELFWDVLRFLFGVFEFVDFGDNFFCLIFFFIGDINFGIVMFVFMFIWLIGGLLKVFIIGFILIFFFNLIFIIWKNLIIFVLYNMN